MVNSSSENDVKELRNSQGVKRFYTPILSGWLVGRGSV